MTEQISKKPWVCKCGQTNSDWAAECGRCERHPPDASKVMKGEISRNEGIMSRPSHPSPTSGEQSGPVCPTCNGTGYLPKPKPRCGEPCEGNTGKGNCTEPKGHKGGHWFPNMWSDM
jgi:hypothetical protein